MVSDKKAVAILVGGGPAPGINGVISAATIEAINRGHKVYGIRTGFEVISKGDLSCVRELGIVDVSTIDREGGSVLGTSRANPTKKPEMLENTVATLRKLNVGYLVTIGGDDTANSARAVAKAAGGDIRVGHVPKTIDNDLPLPGKYSTFGFQSAREVGTEIVETLMVDARTTSRWYLVIAMGRKAGHLALGIGMSAGATLSVIPEEFGEKNPPLSVLVDIIAGSILKRLAWGRPYGVAVLAEGLVEKMDLSSIPEIESVERDPHGNIRFAEIDFGWILKSALRRRLKELGVSMTVVEKNVGYELRCRPPISFDREYTRQLGYGIVNYLLKGGSEAMISLQGDELLPVPFEEMLDPATGKTRIRMVDTDTDYYRVARKYMIRLSKNDLNNHEFMGKMASHATAGVEKLKEVFSPSTSEYSTYPGEFDS